MIFGYPLLLIDTHTYNRSLGTVPENMDNWTLTKVHTHVCTSVSNAIHACMKYHMIAQKYFDIEIYSFVVSMYEFIDYRGAQSPAGHGLCR